VTATLEIAFVLPERIHLRLLNPDAFTIARIMRADVNGTRTVRTLSGQLPSTVTVIDVDDFEYALAGGPITYTVYNGANAVVATATTAVGPYPHSVVIGVPLYPSDGVTLADGTLDPATTTFAITWDGTRNARTTVHDVIGRPDPIAVLRAVALQSGSITLIGPQHLAVDDLAATLALPRVFMLRQADVPGLDMYFVVTGLGLTNIDGSLRWQLVVNFTEVTWPNGVYLPITVWTYADLAAGYADYNAVASSFADYLAVLENRPT